MKKKVDRLGTIKMIISSQEIRLQEDLMQELQNTAELLFQIIFQTQTLICLRNLLPRSTR